MKVYSAEQTARILSAINSIMLGNNGYADIGPADWLADAVRTAGFIVLSTTNLHGRPTYKGYTREAQASLRAAHAAGETYAVSTYKKFTHQHDETDWEGMILARQERQSID